MLICNIIFAAALFRQSRKKPANARNNNKHESSNRAGPRREQINETDNHRSSGENGPSAPRKDTSGGPSTSRDQGGSNKKQERNEKNPAENIDIPILIQYLS